MSPATGVADTFDREGEIAFVRSVLARHPAAVERFTDRMRCVPRMLGGMNARRGCPLRADDVDELVQETIAIVLRKLDSYRAFGSLECWLHRLCKLEFLNAMRRSARNRKRTRSIDDNPETAHVADTSCQDHDDVHLALERLGGVEAEVIRMHHFEGLTFPEIGRRLGDPPNTAKTRYHRGMTRLEAILRTYHRREQQA